MTNQEHFVEVAVARACKVVTCDLYLPGNNESKKTITVQVPPLWLVLLGRCVLVF